MKFGSNSLSEITAQGVKEIRRVDKERVFKGENFLAYGRACGRGVVNIIGCAQVDRAVFSFNIAFDIDDGFIRIADDIDSSFGIADFFPLRSGFLSDLFKSVIASDIFSMSL